MKSIVKKWISKRIFFSISKSIKFPYIAAIKLLQKSGDPNNKHLGVD